MFHRSIFSDWWLTQNFLPFSYLCRLWRKLLWFDSSSRSTSSEIPVQFHICFMRVQSHKPKWNQAVCVSVWVKMVQKTRCSLPFYILWSCARMFTRTCSSQSGVAATDSALTTICPTYTLVSFHKSSQTVMWNLQNCLLLCWPWEHNINI